MNMKRKVAREVARRKMKEAGMQHVCKHFVGGVKLDKSKFAEHWKEWVKA